MSLSSSSSHRIKLLSRRTREKGGEEGGEGEDKTQVMLLASGKGVDEGMLAGVIAINAILAISTIGLLVFTYHKVFKVKKPKR